MADDEAPRTNPDPLVSAPPGVPVDIEDPNLLQPIPAITVPSFDHDRGWLLIDGRGNIVMRADGQSPLHAPERAQAEDAARQLMMAGYRAPAT